MKTVSGMSSHFREFGKLLAATEGHRNDTLNRAALVLGQRDGHRH